MAKQSIDIRLDEEQIKQIRITVLNDVKEFMLPFGILCFLEGRKTAKDKINEGWMEYQVMEKMDVIAKMFDEVDGDKE